MGKRTPSVNTGSRGYSTHQEKGLSVVSTSHTTTERRETVESETQSDTNDVIETESMSSVSSIRVGQFPHPPQERPSVLGSKSSEGFLNLFGFLVLIWSAHDMYTMYQKEGVLIDFTLLKSMLIGIEYLMAYWLAIVLFTTLVSVGIEFFLVTLSQKKRISEFVDVMFCTMYGLAQLVLFVVPTVVVFTTNDLSALCRAALACQIVVNSFKMHSYFITNRYFREEIVYSGKYKQNNNKLIFNNQYEKTRMNFQSKSKLLLGLLEEYITFVRIPSLVFEIEFPRTKSINYAYVAQEYGGGLLICLCMYLIIQRFISPQLEKITTYDWYEIMIHLTVPSLIIWMMLFYCVFHSFMNGTAELVRYADREFYLDWWNATSVSQYWKLWNRPVFKFMSRHIYVESMRRVKGFNRVLAALSTFFVTAILHEFVLIITFKVFRVYFFSMVIAQIPLFYVTEKLSGTRLGNVFLWFGFTLCFPTMEFLYFRSALLERGAENF